jgi:hypothetical protein
MVIVFLSNIEKMSIRDFLFVYNVMLVLAESVSGASRHGAVFAVRVRSW